MDNEDDVHYEDDGDNEDDVHDEDDGDDDCEGLDCGLLKRQTVSIWMKP